MKKTFNFIRKGKFFLAFFFLILFTNSAFARDQIQISGSSTVLPYAKIVADSFHEFYPKFKVPVIESGGTGAGIKEFCSGVGENTIDIANGSRAIKQSELAVCYANGVRAIQEIRFGYDGIVFASDIKGPDWSFTPEDIYKALAAKVIVDGKLVNNPYTNWDQINKKLPNWDITVYIPGEKHGTREVFEEKLLKEGCKASGAMAQMKALAMDDKAIAQNCIAVRKDDRAIDIDGDYSETLARIAANKRGIGVFGLAFYENNADRLKVAKINGIIPTEKTIADGEYPVSRPLYFYVKKAHLGVIPGLEDYVKFFLSDEMIGSQSPTVDYGLVPAPDKERKEQRESFEKGTILTINK